MNYRWFIWGLSNGVKALILSGIFWLAAATVVQGWYGLTFVAPIALVAVLLWQAMTKLREKSGGFDVAEIENADAKVRAKVARTTAGFRWMGVSQGVMSWAVAFLYIWAHRPDMIWPAVAMVVSLHYIPFGMLSNIRVYYATALMGVLVAWISIAGFGGWGRITFLGFGMGAVIWATAAYQTRFADDIARQIGVPMEKQRRKRTYV